MQDKDTASVSPHRDDTGLLISQFVEERVDGPLIGEGELWVEAVCAALFSVGFHVTMRLSDVRNDIRKGCAVAVEKRIRDLIESITISASSWIGARIVAGLANEGEDGTAGPPICFDESPLLRARLVVYFNEAMAAMAGRGFSLEVARSHSCFVGLEQVATQLISRQILRSAEDAVEFMRSVADGCDSMAREIQDVLEKTSGRDLA